MVDASDPLPKSSTGKAEARAAEAAAIRRRWITLGEGVALVAVIISGLTFWTSWSDRRDEKQSRQAEQREAKGKSQRIGLVATKAGGDTLRFKAVDCILQSSTVSFPSALGAPAQSTVLDHRVEGEELDKPLVGLAKAAGDQRSGRLPILIESRCEGPDGFRMEKAIYDLAWHIDRRVLLGRSLKLDGLIRRGAVQGNGQARLDRLWTGTRPI